MTYYVIPIYVWHPPSLALKGRHNTAQGVNPVYAIYPQKNSSPPRANGAWRGGGKNGLYKIGLMPYPMLCRPFRAYSVKKE